MTHLTHGVVLHRLRLEVGAGIPWEMEMFIRISEGIYRYRNELFEYISYVLPLKTGA